MPCEAYEIITRAEAIERGLKRFRVEGVCKNGHKDPERHVINGGQEGQAGQGGKTQCGASRKDVRALRRTIRGPSPRTRCPILFPQVRPSRLQKGKR